MQAQHIHMAQRLVALQHGGYVRRRVTLIAELARQLNRIFDCQLGTRTNRKVRGVHRVTHQHHMAAAVEQRPLLAFHPLKIQPRRAAQVTRIGHQRGTLQIVSKDFFTKSNGLLLVGLVQPMR